MECLVVPVIGRIVVFAVAVTQRSVRVQFEVRADELLTLGYGVDLVAQTAVLLVQQVGISKCVCLGSRLAGIDLRVIQLLISQLVVLTGIFDDVCLSAIVNWDGDMIRPDSVTNEIDVACTRGVVPLFISCKTCVIKTEALNELAILRDRFGAPTARALIITSSASTHGRGAMRRRASELDIAVLEQGDLQKEVLLEHLVSLSEMRDSYHGNRQ